LAWETGAVAPLVLCGKQLDMARRAIEVTRPMIHLSHVVLRLSDMCEMICQSG